MEVKSKTHLCAEVCAKGEYFLKSGLFMDCKFLVGAEPPQEIIPAHKLIMSMASPVFETMFSGEWISDNSGSVPVTEIQPKTFKLLIEYIYTSILNTNSVDEICDLCYAAKKFLMPNLVTKCIENLCQNVDAENVLQLYSFARLIDAQNLMEKCESLSVFEEIYTKEPIKEADPLTIVNETYADIVLE